MVEKNGGPEDPRIEVEIRLRRREASGASRTLNESEHAFWRESLLGFLCAGAGLRPEAKEHPIVGERIWNLKECGRESDRIRQAYPFRHDGGVWGEAECMVKRAIWHCDLDLASGYRLRICLSKEHRLESSEALGLLSELATLRQESGAVESARRNGPVPDLIRFKRRLTFERPEWDMWIDSTEVVTKRPRPEGDSSSDLTCFEASSSQSTAIPEVLELEVEFRPCRGIFDSVERVLKACQDISREG